MLNTRTANLLGFLACAGLMAYALYAEYVLYLEPCPLCIFQRLGVIAMGVIFALAALHNPGVAGSRVYAGLLFIATAATVAVAARHIWLQNLPEDLVPACGAGLEYMLETIPLADVLAQVFQGSGECAEVSWRFLGLTMPVWVLISVVTLGLFGLWANLSRKRRVIL